MPQNEDLDGLTAEELEARRMRLSEFESAFYTMQRELAEATAENERLKGRLITLNVFNDGVLKGAHFVRKENERLRKELAYYSDALGATIDERDQALTHLRDVLENEDFPEVYQKANAFLNARGAFTEVNIDPSGRLLPDNQQEE